MMVLDLRLFDIVEGVGFNELFILVTNPFPNPNYFENPDEFETLEIFRYQSRCQRNFVFPTQPYISGSRIPLADTLSTKLLFSSLLFHAFRNGIYLDRHWQNTGSF